MDTIIHLAYITKGVNRKGRRLNKISVKALSKLGKVKQTH